MGLWAVGLLLSSLLLPMQARSQEVTPCPLEWYYGDVSWLPVHYDDSELVCAFFPMPLGALNSLLPAGVSALPVNAEQSLWNSLDSRYSDFGVLVVGFWHYKSVQYLAPYYEEFVAVMVDDPSWSDGFFPMYITSMTLTDEPAVLGGILHWGFPKILGDVRVQSVKPKGFKCFSWADDEMIMKLDVATNDLVGPTSATSILCLTTKEGYLVRTAWVPTAGTEYRSLSMCKSTIHLGQHAIARQLRDLGLEASYSIGQIWAEDVQSTLPRGMCQPLPPAGPSSN